MKKIIPFFILIIFIFSCSMQGESSTDREEGQTTVSSAPDAPSGLTLHSASFCRIVLSWNDNSNNESGFLIERSTNSNFSTFTTINVSGNTSAYSDRNGLNPSTAYYYRVRATNNVGNSTNSNTSNTATLAVPAALIGSRIANHSVVNALRNNNIPVLAIQNAKSALHIGYGHTSHGSQLVDGMSGLTTFANGSGLNGFYSSNTDLFAWNRGGAGGALDLREGDGYGNGQLNLDCGYYNNWALKTKEYLDDPANYQVNVIIWSWCGQAAGYSESGMISNYLTPMNTLESEYPDITFVYMTCHLNGSGEAGNLHQRNQQIRAYCTVNNKWLFDFADIESYDPDGATNYNILFADDACNYDMDNDGVLEKNSNNNPINGDGNWATNWQNAHVENTDWYNCGSAHSLPLNANMKAYAAWWLWARLGGWNP